MRCAAFWAVLGLLFALPAGAGEYEPHGLIYDVKVGVQIHDMPYMWSGFNKEPYSADLNIEVMFSPSLSLFGGHIRPALGATINFEGYTSKVYLDARWQWECPWNIYIAIGLGAAYHNGNDESYVIDPDHKLLGKRVLFHDVVELGYRFDEHSSLSLFFEHISNASTAAKNQGLDTLGLRYGYRF
jgi:hypothetical protein